MDANTAHVGQAVTVKGSRIAYVIESTQGARLDPETFNYIPAAHLVRADGKRVPGGVVSALWENVTPA